MWSYSCYLFFFLFAIVQATASSEHLLDHNQVLLADFPPPIERPGGADVWTVGDVHKVQWNSKGLNYTATQVGSVALGYLKPGGLQWIYTRQLLAANFTLISGGVNVVVPDVPSGNSYFIVVLGNTNNWGPLFSIVNPNKPTATAMPTSLTWPSGSAAPSGTFSTNVP